MNSMSRRYYDPCKKDNYREEEKCPTIIKCGCPSSVQLPVVDVTVLSSANVTLASLTVDTECICDPVIKLDFTSVFTTIVGVVIGAVSIQIFKQCKGQVNPVPVGPSWPVTNGLLAVGIATGNIFTSFFVCDSDTCTEGCCTYTAVATIGGVAGALVGASFNNSTLAAEITCRSNECQKKCRKEHDKY